jgi:hypothetical protein
MQRYCEVRCEIKNGLSLSQKSAVSNVCVGEVEGPRGPSGKSGAAIVENGT